MDEETINKLLNEIKEIKERLNAIEKEQRWIREDIISGNPKERMQKRLLESQPEKLYHKKEKINQKIKIEI